MRPSVQEYGVKFLLAVTRVERLRGLMALHGAFKVLVDCASDPLCCDLHLDCRLALETLVQDAEAPVMNLLTAYRSNAIGAIGKFSCFLDMEGTTFAGLLFRTHLHFG